MHTTEATPIAGRRRHDAPAARARLLRGVDLEEHAIEAAGVRTAVLMGGSGPPLVLLHGGIECGGVYWAPVVARLALSHRLVVPDLPGLGDSAPAPRLDSDTFAAWLAELMDLTCDDEPIIVGHSLGGSLAARFAARHGDRLRGLVLYGAPAVGPYRMPVGLRIVALRCALRPTEGNIERFERLAFLDRDRTRARDPEWLDAFTAYTRDRAAVPHVRRTMRALIRDGTSRIADPELRRIAAPAVLVWGRNDRMTPLSLAEAARARLGLPLHVVDDAGHVAHIEAPGGFADALARATAHRPPNGAGPRRP